MGFQGKYTRGSNGKKAVLVDVEGRRKTDYITAMMLLLPEVIYCTITKRLESASHLHTKI